MENIWMLGSDEKYEKQQQARGLNLYYQIKSNQILFI